MAPKGNGSFSTSLIEQTVGFIHQNFDTTHGGLRGAPKFPQPVLLDFLWRTAWLNKDKALQDHITLTLEKMCLGGIYDQLGGGFARYSTDEEWLAPHFEKMLYDNGLLVSLLTTVWRHEPSPLFERTVRETIEWALREMIAKTDSGDAFTAAYDADSEGVEGKFYVWSEAEIDGILGDESTSFKAAYDVTVEGNWEETNILRRITSFENDQAEQKLDEQKAKLFEVRNKRIWPGRDDKVLSDWNGLILTGMAQAGLTFGEPEWINKAEEIFANLLKLMTKDGDFYHSYCNGVWGTKAYLEDYANLSQTALALYEATGKESYLKQTKEWVEILDRDFRDEKTGGYNFAKSQTVQGLDVRPKPIHDNATPSGNGTMANVLCELYHVTGNSEYQARFKELIKTFGSNDPNEIFGTPGLASALQRFENMEVIALIKKNEEITNNDLLSMASKYSSPNRKILLGDNSSQFETIHPLYGKLSVDEQDTVYVCQVGQCSAPITDAQKLEDHLLTLKAG